MIMDYTGKWNIAGSFDGGVINDFRVQLEKELPSVSYDDFIKNDRELCQTLTVCNDGKVSLDTCSEEDGVITGKLDKDTIVFGDDVIPVKIEGEYLVFCIEGGFVFRRCAD